MKRSTAIHAESATRWRQHLEREQEGINKQTERLAEQLKRLQFYERQITEAQRRGKESFDEDRLLIPRKSKSSTDGQ